MDNFMAGFGIMPDNAFSMGRILCVLALIWFVMAFFTGRNRMTISVYVYTLIGGFMFIGSTACFIYAFMENPMTEKIKIAAVFIGAVIAAVLVLAAGVTLKKHRQRNAAEIDEAEWLTTDDDDDYEEDKYHEKVQDDTDDERDKGFE